MSVILSKSSYVLGIDLGTSTTIASVFSKGKSRLIKIEGNDYIPSVISFLDNDTKLVGMQAKGRMMIDPQNTVASIKRHMGEEGYKVKINDKEYTPEEISAEILQKIVEATKEQENFETLGEIVNAVICIPANFTDNAKQATLKAAKIANLNVLYLLEEPVAAAIMYGFNSTKSQKILVYDLGGGTFDVCILDANTSEDGSANYDILAKEGINQLGGDDFDRKLMEIINTKFLKENNIDILDTNKDQGISKKKLKQAMQKLKEGAEKAKLELSEDDITNVIILNIIQNEEGDLLSIDVEITKEEFYSAIDPLIHKTEEAVRCALENAKLTVEDIDKIILVGGSTLVPRIKERVKDIFGIEPYSNFNPRTIVSEGAAIFGATLSVPSDCVENNELKPEGDINISQIVTHNLGIMISGMRFSKLIEKGIEIPKGEVIREEKKYSTQSDNQTELTLLIYQCDEEIEFINEKSVEGKEKAICIGEFKLTNIPSKPKGEEKIVVKFEVNEENIVNVTAKCISNGSEKNITLDVKRL